MFCSPDLLLPLTCNISFIFKISIMKKATIILTVITTVSLMNGILAFNIMRGLNNLYIATTGVFTVGSATKLLTYASLAPYRTFSTAPTQQTLTLAFPVYTSTSLTWTTIGGFPYFYPVVFGSPWNGTKYHDEDQ
jgi:hypothetical protein